MKSLQPNQIRIYTFPVTQGYAIAYREAFQFRYHENQADHFHVTIQRRLPMERLWRIVGTSHTIIDGAATYDLTHISTTCPSAFNAENAIRRYFPKSAQLHNYTTRLTK